MVLLTFYHKILKSENSKCNFYFTNNKYNFNETPHFAR